MANLQRILGSMLTSGMGGRSRRGHAFSAPSLSPALMGGGSGSFRNAAGIGALAYLGYKAYQEYQKNNPSNQPSGAGSQGRAGAGVSGPSLGERLGSLLDGSDAKDEAATLDDEHALLLIQAMVAAANADGHIDAEERQRIVGKLQQAGGSADDQAVIARELANPLSIDRILPKVHDQDTAEQVYLASRIAMAADTAAERAYLDYLAARLNLDADRLKALNAV